MKTILVGEKATRIEHFSLDVLDVQGRMIGCRVKFLELEYACVENGNSTVEPGIYFGWRTQATRDGENFGSQGFTSGLGISEQQRDEAVAKMIEIRRKKEIG